MSWFDLTRSLGEWGLILLLHLATLEFGIGYGGKVINIYPYFVVGSVEV